MSKVTQIILIAAKFAALLGVPTFFTTWFHAHPTYYALAACLAVLLGNLFPSLLTATPDAQASAAAIKTGTTLAILCLLLLATPVVMHAQTTPTNSLFTTSAGAISINLNGATNVGVENINSLAVTKKINIEETNLISTGASLQGFYGGASYFGNIDTWLKKYTVLPLNTFQFYARAAAGSVQNTTVNKAHFSGKVAGGLLYAPNSDGHFSVQVGEVGYLNAPGFGKHPNGWTFKSGIGWNF